MLTIKLSGDGRHNIRVSNPGTGTRGVSALALDAQEAVEAVQHYFGLHTSGSRVEQCPFCRKVQERRPDSVFLVNS